MRLEARTVDGEIQIRDEETDNRDIVAIVPLTGDEATDQGRVAFAERIVAMGNSKTVELPMVPCDCCGYFGEHVGRLMTECCNGANGCSCRGQAVDCGPCRVCRGTGMKRRGATNTENLRVIRSLAEAGRGYIGSGRRY